MHDPARRREAAAARAKGGPAAGKIRALRGKRAGLATVPELVAFTAGVIHDVLDGTVPVDVARTVLYGLSLQRQLVEVGNLEVRIAELETRLPVARKGAIR